MVVKGLVFTNFVDCGDGGCVRGVEGCNGSRHEGLLGINDGECKWKGDEGWQRRVSGH